MAGVAKEGEEIEDPKANTKEYTNRKFSENKARAMKDEV
jgi:hypothetical protein